MELTVKDKSLKNLPFLELTRYLIYNKKIVAKKGTFSKLRAYTGVRKNGQIKNFIGKGQNL